MVHRRLRLLGTAWVATWICALGCKGTPEPQENEAAAHLRLIAQAYDLALFKSRRGPSSPEDLKVFLKQLRPNDDPDLLLRSPNDKQPYEIVWGVNLDNQEDIAAILAHEKTGVAGKRYVITVARLVRELSDEEFQKANLARGRKPQQMKGSN